MDKRKLYIMGLALFLSVWGSWGQEKFPDGTLIPDWFKNEREVDIEALGDIYSITEYGVMQDSSLVQTERIQKVIDKAAEQGGGVIIIPEGTFLSGSLFFKPKTHLFLEAGATLKGSDDISDFKLLETRIEGQTRKYFAALVNADGVDGFTVSGKGTLNGNGERYWRHFWLRRKFNPETTNLAEMRPRLLFVSNSNNVTITGIKLKNSPFWTSHFYKCKNLTLSNLYITAPSEPIPAPSSDAVDIDVCENVLIKNSYFSVNDDAIALKGGKGPHADKDPNNGGNRNIIIENNEMGFSHSALTLGSESIRNNNIIFRNNKVHGVKRLLWLKMRPDTPQKYENILVENVEGEADNFLLIKPWTQFFDLKGEEKIKKSIANNITMRNIKLTVKNVFNVVESEQYDLFNFRFEKLDITTINRKKLNEQFIDKFYFNKVFINGQKVGQ